MVQYSSYNLLRYYLIVQSLYVLNSLGSGWRIFLSDYHVHSNKSTDADINANINDIYRMAAARGLKQIALCDHYDVNWVSSGKNPDIDFVDSKEQMDKAVKQNPSDTEFLLGIELGQPNQMPEIAEKVLSSYNFDFILCSLHNVTDEEDFFYIDYKNTSIKTIITLWEKYLDELTVLAEYGGFHALAHITYPERYFSKNNILINMKNYYDAFIKLYKILINKGIALEINTSGLRRKMNMPSPSFDLIKLYQQHGGELILTGSDAHNTSAIASGIAFVHEKLSNMGFRYISTVKNKKLTQVKLEI